MGLESGYGVKETCCGHYRDHVGRNGDFYGEDIDIIAHEKAQDMRKMTTMFPKPITADKKLLRTPIW